jgi:hypothetical protein
MPVPADVSIMIIPPAATNKLLRSPTATRRVRVGPVA